jgi:hypothetical protein
MARRGVAGPPPQSQVQEDTNNNNGTITITITTTSQTKNKEEITTKNKSNNKPHWHPLKKVAMAGQMRDGERRGRHSRANCKKTQTTIIEQ